MVEYRFAVGGGPHKFSVSRYFDLQIFPGEASFYRTGDSIRELASEIVADRHKVQEVLRACPHPGLTVYGTYTFISSNESGFPGSAISGDGTIVKCVSIPDADFSGLVNRVSEFLSARPIQK